MRNTKRSQTRCGEMSTQDEKDALIARLSEEGDRWFQRSVELVDKLATYKDRIPKKPGEVVWGTHGVMIQGPVAVGDFGAYGQALSAVGIPSFDTHIAQKLGVLIAAPYPGHHRAWRAELELEDVPLLSDEAAPIILGETWIAPDEHAPADEDEDDE